MYFTLKGRCTIGNCQRPVFSLGEFQHMYKPVKIFSSIGHRSWEKMMKEKTPLLGEFVCFQIGIKDF